MSKRIIRFVVLVLMALSFVACVGKNTSKIHRPLAEGSFSIMVTVDGVLCCDGVLRLAVYDRKKYWMSENGMVRGRLGFVQADSQDFEIHGLPAGRYAVAVYQDIDSDNKLDRWFWLIPKEPYGFSNNVGKYGPASFDKSAFDLQQDKSITIKLNSL